MAKRFCLSILLGSIAVLAQVRSGRIAGTVTDPSDSAIAAAAVEVVEVATNQSYRTQSNAAGQFSVLYLPPGSYSVKVSKEGFAAATQPGITLGTSETVRVDLRLQVRNSEQSVTISENAFSVQTESASVEGTTNRQLIENLPNVNHNPLYFATLQLGATPRASMTQVSGQNSFGIGANGRRQFSALAINGGGAFQNDVQVDGVGVVGSGWNEAAVLPNSEGLQEVRTTVNNYSAEYGRGQGVIIMTTRSGTNEFHGSALYRHRNDFFNANSFGNNARGINRQGFKVHTYGGSFGGPVVKNKAFVFASWEGLKFNEGLLFLRTVPTALERSGNFSQTVVNVNGAARALTLYDPYTVTPTGNNVWTRGLIPNAQIPATRLNAAAVRLFSNYPQPNRAPDDLFNANNFLRSATRRYDRNNLNSRFDYRPTDRHSIYLTGGFTMGNIANPLTWGDDNPFNSATGEQFAPIIRDRNPYASIGDTFVVSPSFVVDVRYGLTRVSTASIANNTPDFDYRAVGIPAAVEAVMAVRRVPNFFTTGLPWSSLSNNAYMHKEENQTNHVLAGSATKTAGKWTLKFGGEMRQNFSNYTDAQESISYRISSGFTAGPSVNATGASVVAVDATQSGHAGASFLMGAGNLEIGRGFNAKPAFLQQYYALYAQTDWRPTNKLTVNLGFRWDAQPGVTDRFNRITSFDQTGTNPYGGKGAFYFPASNGASRRLWEGGWANFAPRLGMAYRVKENLVVRAGYGMTFLPSNTGYYGGPFFYGMQSFAPTTDAQPFGLSPAGVVAGDFAAVTRVIQPTNDDPRSPALYGGPNPRFDVNGFQSPTVHQANAFIEWQKAGWQFAAGWSGAYGRKLATGGIYTVNNDQLLPGATLSAWRDNYISRNGTGHLGTDQVTNPFQPTNGPLIPFLGSLGNARMQLRETLYPFPMYGNMQLERYIGGSDYNAAMFRLNRQFASGLMITAHYTFSKAMEVNGPLLQYNFGAEGYSFPTGNFRDYSQNRRLSSNDIPHRVVATWLYELPFGKGKKLSPGNSVLNYIASGWQLSGTWMLQTGTPILATGASNGSLNGRPDVVAGADFELPKNIQGWYDGRTRVTLPSGRVITPCNFCFLKYNPDAFTGRTVRVANGTVQRDQYWWGNAGFTFSPLRNDRLNNITMSVQRQFKLTERLELSLQAHAHNLLNHTQFNPGYTMGLGNTEIVEDKATGRSVGAGQNANFGTHGLGTFDPRNMEFVLKLRF